MGVKRSVGRPFSSGMTPSFVSFLSSSSPRVGAYASDGILGWIGWCSGCGEARPRWHPAHRAFPATSIEPSQFETLLVHATNVNSLRKGIGSIFLAVIREDTGGRRVLSIALNIIHQLCGWGGSPADEGWAREER